MISILLIVLQLWVISGSTNSTFIFINCFLLLIQCMVYYSRPYKYKSSDTEIYYIDRSIPHHIMIEKSDIIIDVTGCVPSWVVYKKIATYNEYMIKNNELIFKNYIIEDFIDLYEVI